jgi:hypothetical protein
MRNIVPGSPGVACRTALACRSVDLHPNPPWESITCPIPQHAQCQARSSASGLVSSGWKSVISRCATYPLPPRDAGSQSQIRPRNLEPDSGFLTIRSIFAASSQARVFLKKKTLPHALFHSFSAVTDHTTAALLVATCNPTPLLHHPDPGVTDLKPIAK